MQENTVVLMNCGDVGPIHEPMDNYSTLVRQTLATADIRVAQCERVYSERGSLHPASGPGWVKPHMASIFTDCGFDVLSVASNHALDGGPDALLDSIELLRSKGIKTVGGGRNLEESRRPAIINRNGVSMAFLAYCSVLQPGYWAGHNKPGISPLRVHTYYEPMEYQAGMPPRIVTIPYEDDLQGMVDDITAMKKAGHIVILNLHWGLHFIPRIIADYQVTVAHAAFAAGADIIMGHHAHVPKAIGVYGGKVCFYSLSNFMISSAKKSPPDTAAFARRYGVTMDPDYPLLPYGTDAKRSMIAKVVIARDGIKKVSFLPALIDQQLRPEILKRSDPRFDEAVSYMEWASDGFEHRFDVEGDEVVVS